MYVMKSTQVELVGLNFGDKTDIYSIYVRTYIMFSTMEDHVDSRV